MQTSARAALIALSDLPPVKHTLTRTGMTRGFVRRFVAGETWDDALAVARALHTKRIDTAFDLLGENVATDAEAQANADAYLHVLDSAVADRDLRDVYLSIKLTALGMDIGDGVARRHLRALLSAAQGRAFVRVDMESSAYTERTLALVREAHWEFPGTVGTVLQSALRRTEGDVDDLNAEGISVRLVKGAYLEPDTVAYARKADVDAAYVRQAERLLLSGTRPALATHDDTIIRHVKRFVREHSVPNDGFEFQMLLGIQRDVQEALASEGYHVRAYVPFGVSWYPYFVRRLAERPANALFILRSLLHK